MRRRLFREENLKLSCVLYIFIACSSHKDLKDALTVLQFMSTCNTGVSITIRVQWEVL